MVRTTQKSAGNPKTGDAPLRQEMQAFAETERFGAGQGSPRPVDGGAYNTGD